MNTKTGLVLEGGGMRGTFTAGALDYFMDNNISFPYTIGVSAGACNGVSYSARQRGRARACNIDLYDKYKYISVKNLILKQNLIDYKLLFNDFPEKIIPLDYEAFFSNKNRTIFVASNCETGKAEYLEEHENPQRLNKIVQASSSLPFVADITELDGKPMLDGGICDAIPVEKALSDGYEKLVIILTRNKNYRKSNKEMWFPSFFYKKYPKIQKRLKNKNFDYNKVLDFIDEQEKKGQFLVIRPINKIKVSRLEKDIEKLEELYQQGYECARVMVESHPDFFPKQE
jgi:predicted patatin/cPLA2 family phospholipase